MARYLERVTEIIPTFDSFDIRQISRSKNARADLSKLATLALAELPKEVFFEVLKHPSTKESWFMMEIRDRKSTRLNSSHSGESRMPSSA